MLMVEQPTRFAHDVRRRAGWLSARPWLFSGSFDEFDFDPCRVRCVEPFVKSHFASSLAAPVAVLAVVCGVLVAVLAPRLAGNARVAVAVAGITVALLALGVSGYLLGRSTTRGGS